MAVKCRKMGADEYITKPSMQQLIELMDKYCLKKGDVPRRGGTAKKNPTGECGDTVPVSLGRSAKQTSKRKAGLERPLNGN